jgi:hypothetical protein
MIAVLAAALIASVTAIWMGVAERRRGDERIRPVRLVSDGSAVPHASSMLTRSARGADFTFSTSGLPAGHVVTWKAVIFNKPEQCTHGVGRLRCGGDDLSNPEVEGSVVYVTSLFLPRYVPVDNVQGHLAADDKSRALIGNGLTNPQGADVHLVVVDRGPPIQGPLYGEMLSTLGAGCNNAPPGWGTPGPNTCVDIQISAHEQ